MRKIIALLLTVLMLASALAVLPASAANATYDGTTADTVNKILITEIGRNMSYTRNPVAATENAMNFVEIYNNSNAAIDLDTLSLLLAVEIPTRPTDEASRYLKEKVEGDEESVLWRQWSKYKRFLSEMEIKSGEIVDAATASSLNISSLRTQYLKNPDVSVASGKSAVIWLVTKETVDWLNKATNQIADFNPKTEFLKNYYGNQVNPDDYTVVMVWAYSDYTEEDPTILADDMFNFEFAPAATKINENYIIGVANNTWDVDADVAYDAEKPAAQRLHQDLYSMTVLGTAIQNYSADSETSAVFAPAGAKPFVQNAYDKFLNPNAAEHTDYFAAGLVRSYRECGVISFACAEPTPGKIPAWHQLMIDDAKRDLTADELNQIQTHIVETYKYADDGSNAGRNEDGIEHNYNFESQEDIKNRFNNKKKKDTVTDEGGLPTWALILIIVGGVVVVAGGACAVVFLVILPKKKAAAAAIAQEAPVEEAPVEDAPVEDAPAEESKDE